MFGAGAPKGPKRELCYECGVGVEIKDMGTHKCDRERRLDFKTRLDAWMLDREIEIYLDSNEAKFFEHLASRARSGR